MTAAILLGCATHFVQIAPFVCPPLILVGGLVAMVVADRVRHHGEEDWH
jgi:hypothetical protein